MLSLCSPPAAVGSRPGALRYRPQATLTVATTRDIYRRITFGRRLARL